MAVRIPSIPTSSHVPLDGFAICDSRGRRVSLLNEDDEYPRSTPYSQHTSLQHYPLSSAYTSGSGSIETPFHHGCYNSSPETASPWIPSISQNLPPLNDPIASSIPNHEAQESVSHKASISSLSEHSRHGCVGSITSRRGSNSSNHSKGTRRRYECTTCGKTFTTSGHVARHNRIHTGEKNFQCPEPGCLQRFSRQDNCMQHYRTHKAHPPKSDTLKPARRTSSSSTARQNKKKQADGGEPLDTSTDPDNRLSAFATYISVYA